MYVMFLLNMSSNVAASHDFVKGSMVNAELLLFVGGAILKVLGNLNRHE